MRSIALTLIMIALAALPLCGYKKKLQQTMENATVASDMPINNSNYGMFEGTYTGIQLQLQYLSAPAGTTITGIEMLYGTPDDPDNPQLAFPCTLSQPYAVPPGNGATLTTITTPLCFFGYPVNLGAGTPWYAAVTLGNPASTIDASGGSITTSLISPTLAWQDNTANQVEATIWYVGSAAPPGTGVAAVGWDWLYTNAFDEQYFNSNYRPVGAADFDGNGSPDVVWTDAATGQVTVWYDPYPLNGTFSGWIPLQAEPGWVLAAVAVTGVNGEQLPALIWQNSKTGQVAADFYSVSTQSSLQSWAIFNTPYPAGNVVAAADFLGTGYLDLVWQSGNLITVSYYGQCDTTAHSCPYISQGTLNPATSSGWRVIGASDYNGDGVPDLIYQNPTTGQVTVNYYGPFVSVVNPMIGWNWVNQAGAPGWTAFVPN